MKKIFKSLIVVLILSIITSTSAIAVSSADFILKKASYPILVSGTNYTDPELPLLNYQGSTYVPLRAIGELYGANIGWNEKLRQVEIGESNVSSRVITFDGNDTEELQKYVDDNQLKIASDVKVSLNGKSLATNVGSDEILVDSLALTLNERGETVELELYGDGAVRTSKIKVKVTCCPLTISVEWEKEKEDVAPGSSFNTEEVANKEITFDLHKDGIQKELPIDGILQASEELAVEFNNQKIDYLVGRGIEATYKFEVDKATIKFNENGEATSIRINSDLSEENDAAAMAKPKIEVSVSCCPVKVTVKVTF